MQKTKNLFLERSKSIGKPASGILIDIEGTDGSGKATQTKALIKRLKKEGWKVETVAYPRHGYGAAHAVDEYLRGRYGPLQSVNPHIHSMFYALDRYDGGFKIRKWLSEGRVVVCDRYTFSNVGHAGAKIADLTAWKKFTKWVCDLEFEFFGIPKPDLVVILKNEAKLANHLSGRVSDKKKLAEKASYLGKKRQDIHEKDTDHLARSIESYERLGRFMPKLCKVVSVGSREGMRPIAEIHEEVWRLVMAVLEK